MAGDLPDFLVAGGWQDSDDDHPPGEGTPAYRVVYKTLKTFLPESKMVWPNLVMRTGYGSVRRGGIKLDDVLPLRREGRWFYPQPGATVVEGQMLRFEATETKNFEFKAWQEEVEELFFVEFVLHTTADKPDRRLEEGRSGLARLKTLIELTFGPRVLGALVTEGLGEVFPDGHFNRSLESDAVGNEWQMGLAAVTREEMEAWAKTTLGPHQERPEEELQRVRLACDWYWRSTQTADLVTEYLELWFVVEVIAMPDDTDVRPVRECLAQAFGGSGSEWKDFVGKHFGRRSKLVHGDAKREVEEQEVESLRDLVQALLELEFGISNDERREGLRRRAGIGAGV
ncbi:MAG: hypothetical protein ACRDLF_00400 [Solirubrobacteraceae bacterium]